MSQIYPSNKDLVTQKCIFYERIAKLESLVENTKKLQTDQILKELDATNNILTKLLDENILRKF